MCLAVVIEVCILAPGGEMISVTEPLEGTRMDGPVCDTVTAAARRRRRPPGAGVLPSERPFPPLMEQRGVGAFLTVNGLLLSSSCRCRRLAKEKISYQTEAQQQEEKVKRLKEEAGDPYVIKKQVSFF